MKSYNFINIIKVIISISFILILFSCSSRKILLDFPPYTDEVPQIQTGYYSVYETENGVSADTIGNEFLGELIYLYKADFLEDGKYYSGIKGSFLPNNYIRTKLVKGENVYYWYDAVNEEKSGEIIFSTIAETKLFAQVQINSSEKIEIEFKFYGNQLYERPLKTIPIAHRGVCYQPPNNYDGIFPANTFPGFETALISGYKGFELDVRVTKDKRFMISHDEDLSAATTLRGFVRDKNLSDFENALVIKSAAIPENKATAAEAFIAAPMKPLNDIFYHFIDDPRLQTFVVDVKPDSDENILAAAKHDFDGLSIERQKKVLFLTRAESTAKILKDLCPYSDIALEGSIGTEPVEELEKYFPEAAGLPRQSHNTISFGSNWILAFKSADTSIEQIKKVMDNGKNLNYKVCMWTFAKEDRLNFLRENNFYPDFILCDVPYYQFALQNLRYVKEENIKLPSKDEILIKYKNPIYKRVYKQYLTEFWFQSRNLIELSYGMKKFSNNDLNGSFANAGKIELKLGRSELDKFSKTNALLNEWYLMFAYSNSEFAVGNAESDDISSEFYHFGVGQTEGLGYYGPHISFIPYISQSLIWSKMDEYSSNSNTPISPNDEEILARYKDTFRFGDRVLYGFKFDILSTLQLSLNYETGVIYPRTLFLKWAGSFLLAQVGYNALNVAAGKWVDDSPVFGPIVNMLIRTGYLYAYYALRKDNMNWPFQTETPLRYEGFNFALSFVL